METSSTWVKNQHVISDRLNYSESKSHYFSVINYPYKTTATDGTSYRVAVSFVSSHGHIATNVSEAVWHWMQNPGGIWYTLQRISPWNPESLENNHWDHAVMAAMDIRKTQPLIQPTKF